MDPRILMAVLASLLAGGALAQTNPDNAARFRERVGSQLAERFSRADANGDGRLTREEAQGTMPRVYDNFDKIDVDHKGYLTQDQLRAYAAEQFAERRATGGR